MKIRDMLEDSRPREKLSKFGAENLSEDELLAIILGTGNKEENVIDISNRLIARYGLDKLSECSLKELQENNGIGFAKACQIVAIFELNKRHNLARKDLRKITCAKDVFDIFGEKLRDQKQENFFVLLLDSKNKILKEELISKGILDASIIHPREVFKSAIKESAYSIILVHNHPSGDPAPSKEDIEITNRLKEVGELMNIPVLDHVIVGTSKFWSFREIE